ncbi:MAG: serine hydrolase [Burkholderiaceae bacterium]
MSTEIDRVIEFQRAAGHYPGIVMHVEREGAVLLERCVGAMGPGSDAEPMRDDAFFRIASLTKGIVSTVAMMFVESGDIVLDAPVAEYLPVLDGLRMADGSRPLRPPSVRDLMRHTSGLAYAGETRDPAARARADAIGLDARLFSLGADEVLETLCRLPLCAQPGTTFRYGFSTDVLGLVIEAVSSRRLGEVIGDRLLEPLTACTRPALTSEPINPGGLRRPILATLPGPPSVRESTTGLPRATRCIPVAAASYRPSRTSSGSPASWPMVGSSARRHCCDPRPSPNSRAINSAPTSTGRSRSRAQASASRSAGPCAKPGVRQPIQRPWAS